jgi:hypothetical protein
MSTRRATPGKGSSPPKRKRGGAKKHLEGPALGSRKFKHIRYLGDGVIGVLPANEVKSTGLQELLSSEDLVPQAVVNNPVQAFAKSVQVDVVTGADDLDEYEGVAFSVDGVPIAVMRYKGHPPGTSTIYIPRRLSEVKTIGEILRTIFHHFVLPTSAMVWQREDNPEL